MRSLVLASAVLSVAAMLVVPAEALTGQHARYCPSRDAYETNACGAPPRLPHAPVSGQLSWVRRQLAGDAATLSEEQVGAHFSPGMLAGRGTSAPELVIAMQSTLARFGPLRFVGFSYPPRSHQAMPIFTTHNGSRRLEVPISVTRRTERINSLAVTKANPVIVPRGRYSGWYDVGGRRLFLRCSGRGTPTVVFENGLTTDWYVLQNRLSSRTRTCSYDPARQAGPQSRSDSAPAPRTGNDRVRDLWRLLRVARVPGPYVLAGHSNGGLFSLEFASRHPQQAAGLVLIDGVHPSYHQRTFNALKHLIPPADWPAARRQYCAVPTLQQDWEQMDICAAERQARAQLSARSVRAMPLAVLSHGIPEGSPGPERDIAERVWTRLQRQLAALVPGSEHVIARRSPHDIQHTQPGLVLAEVRKVVAAVRQGRSALLCGTLRSDRDPRAGAAS
jgi:pimeloyl-ACP methyl ester carboxylesterase